MDDIADIVDPAGRDARPTVREDIQGVRNPSAQLHIVLSPDAKDEHTRPSLRTARHLAAVSHGSCHGSVTKHRLCGLRLRCTRADDEREEGSGSVRRY
jgi:hypothetical protein